MPYARNRYSDTLALLVIFTIGATIPLIPAHGDVGWSSPSLIESHAGTDILPTALQASNGTLWLAWQSNRYDQVNGRTDILYKTYTNGVWSTVHNLTSSGYNSGASLIQLSNGTILALWVIKSGTSFMVFSSGTNGASWSSPVQTTSTTLNDTQPSAAIGRDGTIWLVWTRINSTCSSCAAIKQLYYKTWKMGTWSSEVQLTNDSNQNYGASTMVGKDGIVRVTWSKGTAGSAYQLYTKIYNGVTWSSETQIVSSSSTDEHPSMIQDRNGTLWLFWGRLVVVSPLVQYYEVVGKHSYDLGSTWSPEIILTGTSTTIDSFMPSAVQSNTAVKPIWVFYASNQSVPDYDIFAVMSTGIYPVHDVTVSALSSSSNLGTSWEYSGGLSSVGQSAIVTAAVRVANIGDYVENVSVTLKATNTSIIAIGTLRSLLGPGNMMNFYFYWNTTNVKPARYGFSVSVATLPGETMGNLGDNNYSLVDQIHILPFGDINQDGSVTITDFSVLVNGFDYSSTCNCSQWNPYADINGNGVIDIVDVGVVEANYGIST